MSTLPPSRSPITLRPALPTMLLIRPRNIRRADYVRRLRILEAVATWSAVAGLAWYLLTH
jgi:hypothetical protein